MAMRVKRIASLVFFLLPATSFAQAPLVVTKSEVAVAGEVEKVETLDSTPVYRFTVNLDPARHPVGTNVEYVVYTDKGVAAGGGMFTIRPEMLSADGRSLSVLAGFWGVELGADSKIVVQLADLASSLPGPSPKRAVGASGITDTCTSYCDRCAEKTQLVCPEGVKTYSCGCASESRTCNFECHWKN